MRELKFLYHIVRRVIRSPGQLGGGRAVRRHGGGGTLVLCSSQNVGSDQKMGGAPDVPSAASFTAQVPLCW